MSLHTMTLQEKLPLLPSPSPSPYVLVIHGGAGTMSKEGSTPEQRAAYKTALAEALRSVGIPCLHNFVAHTDSGLFIGLSPPQHWWGCYRRRGCRRNCHGRSASLFLYHDLQAYLFQTTLCSMLLKELFSM